jgi:hypothetical protein
MNAQVQAALIAAMVAGLFTALGWYTTHRLATKKEEHARRQEATLKHLQRQIEELYGPLLGLIQHAGVVFEVAASRVPRTPGGAVDQARFSTRDADVWNYFTEGYFLPLNAQIESLLRKKIYLLESIELPPSFQEFFRHQAAFECLHRLWKEKGVDSSDFRSTGWPKEFETDVKSHLEELRRRHRQYLEWVGGI